MSLPAGWPEGVRLIRFASLESTNEEARRFAAAGDNGPLWITAREQTNGRGRRGNRWISQSGNLFATLLLPATHATAAQLGFAASLAAADVLSSYAGAARVSLKWPNDVLLNDRKVAGILLETFPLKLRADLTRPSSPPDEQKFESHLPLVGRSNRRSTQCEAVRVGGGESTSITIGLAIGIGINLLHNPEGTETPAISVNAATGRAPDVDEALGNLATRFAAWYGMWQRHGFGGLKPHWLERATGLGGPIRARLANREMNGVFEDLDQDGALLLRTADSTLTRITAADVFLGDAA